MPDEDKKDPSTSSGQAAETPEQPAPEAAPQPQATETPQEPPPHNRRWYVIRVQTGREKGVKVAIEKSRVANKEAMKAAGLPIIE